MARTWAASQPVVTPPSHLPAQVPAYENQQTPPKKNLHMLHQTTMAHRRRQSPATHLRIQILTKNRLYRNHCCLGFHCCHLAHCLVLALAEVVLDTIEKCAKVRRLHLIIVDLWRSWKFLQSNIYDIIQAMRKLHPHRFTSRTTPTLTLAPPKPKHNRLYVCGCALDGSDYPCCLIWPQRTTPGHFCALDTRSKKYCNLSQVAFIRPLGVEHQNLRVAALRVLQLPSESVH